jgi:epidermal growth factor receptor substrate 15
MAQGNGYNVWDVTSNEKTDADAIFDGLDTEKLGYIEGDVAVPFMIKSQLPGEDLAQIWFVFTINLLMTY